MNIENILKEQGNICPYCKGKLYIKITLWHGKLMRRIKCKDCGHLF